MGQAGEAGWTIGRRSITVAMGKTDKGKGPENLFPGERVAQGWATLDKQAKQGEQRLRVRSGLRSFERLTREGKAGLYAKRKVRTPIQGGMGWVKTEGLNAQYREVLGRYPSEWGVRSTGSNGAWNAKCCRRSAAGIFSVSCKASAIPD